MLAQVCLCPRKQGTLGICMLVVELPLTRWQVGLTCLGNLAFDNIRSQMDEKNIVGELFSPFTAERVVSPFAAVCILANPLA